MSFVSECRLLCIHLDHVKEQLVGVHEVDVSKDLSFEKDCSRTLDKLKVQSGLLFDVVTAIVADMEGTVVDAESDIHFAKDHDCHIYCYSSYCNGIVRALVVALAILLALH